MFRATFGTRNLKWRFCVRGKIRLTLDGEALELRAGDSVFYDASRPRQWDARRPGESSPPDRGGVLGAENHPTIWKTSG